MLSKDLWKILEAMALKIVGPTSVYFPRKVAALAWALFTRPKAGPRKLRGVFLNRPLCVDHLLANEKIRVYKFGDFKAKKILLVHGWASSSGDFYELIPKLCEEGYQCIAFDGPAHGASSGKYANIAQFVEIIRELCKIYGPFDCMLGHSFGGAAIALSLKLHPELIPPHVITIASPNSLKDIFDGHANRLRLSKKARDLMEKRMLDLTGVKVGDAVTGKIFKSIKTNILNIHDRDDKVVPLSIGEKLSSDSGGEFYVTQGLGHNRILYHLDVISKIISFLN